MRKLVTWELPWALVGDIVSAQLGNILGKEIKCKASLDDWDYWAVSFIDYRMPINEIKLVCSNVHATDDEKKDAMPMEGEKNVGSLGNAIVDKLLSNGMGASWELSFAKENALYLIGCEERDCINIGKHLIFYDTLKSKEELIDYFIKNSPTERSLSDFCHDYAERYQNSLYWHYPLSDSEHLGAYLVLVKEGVLYVPYDDADKVSCELFCLEDIKLVDADDVFDMERNFEDNATRFLENIRVLRSYLVSKMKDEEDGEE